MPGRLKLALRGRGNRRGYLGSSASGAGSNAHAIELPLARFRHGHRYGLVTTTGEP